MPSADFLCFPQHSFSTPANICPLTQIDQRVVFDGQKALPEVREGTRAYSPPPNGTRRSDPHVQKGDAAMSYRRRRRFERQGGHSCGQLRIPLYAIAQRLTS